MRRPELVILVAIWEFIAAFIALVGLAAILIIAFPAVMYEFRYGVAMDRTGYVGAIFGMSLACIILVIYLTISITGGIGILQGREWARILSITQAALSLFSIPFGTIIGILIIIYLTRTEVRDYFVRPVMIVTPPAPPSAPPANPAP